MHAFGYVFCVYVCLCVCVYVYAYVIVNNIEVKYVRFDSIVRRNSASVMDHGNSGSERVKNPEVLRHGGTLLAVPRFSKTGKPGKGGFNLRRLLRSEGEDGLMGAQPFPGSHSRVPRRVNGVGGRVSGVAGFGYLGLRNTVL
jgi:hypothetical protein